MAKKNIWRLAIFLIIFNCGSFGRADFQALPPEMKPENQPRLVEMYRICLENRCDGLISVSSDEGRTWQQIGEVISPITQTDSAGFTASKWGKTGSVVATAVNAIHIKTAENNLEEKGVVFSILPSDSLPRESNGYNSYFNRTTSIYTNIRGGTSIFGGRWSVFVGNLVYLQENNRLTPLEYGYQPRLGDKLTIVVRRPEPYPSEMIFENQAGGLIYLRYRNGEKRAIGQVLKPVQGIGRFIGTLDSEVGRIRANHCGVIDISTSPLGKVGGFQIIPAKHSESPEMAAAKIKTQWMIVAPLYGLDEGAEGLAPLFSEYLTPRYAEEDLYADNWIEKIAQRTLVSVEYSDVKGWQPMPVLYVDPNKPLPEEANTALKDVSRIRILFPRFK